MYLIIQQNRTNVFHLDCLLTDVSNLFYLAFAECISEIDKVGWRLQKYRLLADRARQNEGVSKSRA